MTRRPAPGQAGGASVATIGYENATPDRLVAALREAGIATLVDVRAVANSRRPGFAKRALSAAMEEAGIGYLHLPALGTPAAGRQAARSGRPEVMRRIFTAHLAGTEAQAALSGLADQARGGRLLVADCRDLGFHALKRRARAPRPSCEQHASGVRANSTSPA